MILQTSEMPSAQIYHTVTQTLLPRPIAWALTRHIDGHFNLAPFSYFTAISSEPPLLMFSVGDKQPGEGKDTKVNLAQHPYFTVHIPSVRHASQVTESSRTIPAAESELDHIDMELVPFEGFVMPRLADCAIAFGCRVHDIQPVKGAPQSLVFGYIEQIFIDDTCAHFEPVQREGKVQQRLVVNAQSVDPLARLGSNEYGTLGRTLTVPRPR